MARAPEAREPSLVPSTHQGGSMMRGLMILSLGLAIGAEVTVSFELEDAD
jgi:hypothetical protein